MESCVVKHSPTPQPRVGLSPDSKKAPSSETGTPTSRFFWTVLPSSHSFLLFGLW